MCRLFLLLVLLIVGAPFARAHPDLQDAMWVQFEPTLVRVAVNVSVKELSIAHQIPANSDDVDVDHWTRTAESHRDYVIQHLQLTAPAGALPGKVVHLATPGRIGDWERTFFQYEIEYPYAGTPPAEVRISHTMLNEWPYSAGTAWQVSYVMHVKRSDQDQESSALLSDSKPTTILTGWTISPSNGTSEPAPPPAPPPTRWDTFRDYLGHGVMHILTGYDHLLFVSALVIATLGFWEMVKVVAAFTLAHTITLILCAFGIFRLPSYVVEPVIALSIVVVALENIFRPRESHSKVRLGVAFGFGLIHGLGFAGGLLDAMAGLPVAGLWTALVGFSCGVEIGHQIVVLPLFALVLLIRRHAPAPTQKRLLRSGSALISCCGLYYLAIALHQQFGG